MGFPVIFSVLLDVVCNEAMVVTEERFVNVCCCASCVVFAVEEEYEGQ